MALVKKSKIKPGLTTSIPPRVPRPVVPAAASRGRRETVSERIAAATEQLASGLAQAAAATKQLGHSMAQIASGAEQAAGASQEQSGAISGIVESLNTARIEAERSNRQTEVLSNALTDTSTQILNSVRAIERAADRQSAAAALVGLLDQRAKDIGEITRTVSRLSDQTNLLALNAAIEAARAGAQGRGFAVVADEVRNLAETSDKSARDVQTLTEAIQADVIEVGDALRKTADTAKRDARAAAAMAQALEARREDMLEIAAGSHQIRTATIEAERAAVEALKGAEQVASAAEEQSSGAGEAQVAIEQQAKSLDQGQQAAHGLAALAEKLRSGRTSASAMEQITAGAEQLSASIQELSSAATEVMAAVEQISKASRLQASATQQTTAALTQIESSAKLAKKSAQVADGRVKSLDSALKEGRSSVERLVTSVAESLTANESSAATTKRLDTVARNIEKIVDAIALVAVQTSMLAVSGSVEAARAGELGKGFAVVSSDIRRLSREASNNVERAKETVRGILDQIALLKTSLDQFIVAAEIEVQNNRMVTSMLHRIEKDVAGLGAASRSIFSGADATLTATTEIAKAARQIATAAEETSAGAREAATAAAEQSKGAEDLAAAIEEIASLADELEQNSA